jgi:hypothetical protein
MVADTETTVVIRTSRPVRVRRIGWWLLGVSVTLSVLSMAIPALIDHPLTTERGEVRVYFDVFSEGNLPTWWSVGLLVLTAVTHAVTGALAPRFRFAWFVSAAVLGALSLDDHTSLHERLERIGQSWVTFERFPGYWLVPGIFAGLAVAVALGLLAAKLRGVTRWCMIAGLALVQGLLVAEGESGPLYVLVLHAEELGENLGVLLMLTAAIRSLDITRDADGRLSVGYVTQP